MFAYLAIFFLPTFAYYFAKAVWRWYLLRSAEDPLSNLSHLPIPPGDFGLPVIGETLLWAVQGSHFNSIRRQKYGKLFSTNFIGKTMIKVTGQENVKQLLTADYDTVSTVWPYTVRSILGVHSIANTAGPLHKHKRRMCLRAFSQRALNSYIPTMRKVIRQKMEMWTDLSRVPICYKELKQLTFDIAIQCLAGITCEPKEQQRLFETFDCMISNLFSLPYDLPGSGLRKGLAARKILHQVLDVHLKEKREIVQNKYSKINETQNSAEDNNSSTCDALQYILEEEIKSKMKRPTKSPKEEEYQNSDEESNDSASEAEEFVLSDLEIKETTVELLFAGYQTNASTTTSTLINLIKNPGVFKKIECELRMYGFLPPCHSSGNKRSEIDEMSLNGEISEPTSVIDNSFPTTNIFRTPRIDENQANELQCNNNNVAKNGTNASNCRSLYEDQNEYDVTMERLSKLVYMDQVIKETLRVHPPILGGYRIALKTFTIGNYRIPKGWTLIYNIRDTHEYEWSEDMEFKPERFSRENWNNKDGRYRWLPFGAGPRMCVGKEFARLQMKLLLIEVVRYFSKLEFAKGKPPKMFALPFLHPTDGLPLKLTLRN